MTPVKVSSKRKAEYSDLENTCKKIGAKIQNGSLVIVASLVGIGLMEGLIRETLENTSGLKTGSNFGLAYSPVQSSQDSNLDEFDCQRIVSASDKDSLRAATLVLEKLDKKDIRKTADLKSAEVAALLKVLERDTKIAFINEATLLCEKAGVDYLEASKVIDNGKRKQSTTLLADDTVSDEPYLLLADEESFNLKPRIAVAARQTNEETHKHLANLVKDALKSCGKTLKRARITLLGVTQVPNSQAAIKKTAIELIETLEGRGAKISVYDPYLTDNEITETTCQIKKNLIEALDRVDCTIIFTAHDNFKHMNLKKMKLTMKMPAAIIDLCAVADPSKVEKEGFVYRRLGRGV
jgi:UDP-N-acetyl-D-galactosamine dehydrogenase